MQRLEVPFLKWKDCPQVLLERWYSNHRQKHFPSGIIFGKKEEEQAWRKVGATKVRLLPSHLFLGLIWLRNLSSSTQGALKYTKSPSHPFHYLLSNVLLGTPGNINIVWSPAYHLHVFLFFCFFSFLHSIDLCNLATWKAKEQHASSNSNFETPQGTIKIPEFIRDAIYLQGGECGHGGLVGKGKLLLQLGDITKGSQPSWSERNYEPGWEDYPTFHSDFVHCLLRFSFFSP